jgi:hypothetical protein
LDFVKNRGVVDVLARVGQVMAVEKRKSARRDIDLAVQIRLPGGACVCGIALDVSQGGARLKVESPDRLPDQFMLELSDKLHRWSHIVWRSAEEAGVEFLSVPQAIDEGRMKPFVLIRCPRTGKDIWTGIRLTAADDLAKLAGVRRFAQCRHCKVVHGWTAKEASLNAMPG